MRYTSLLLIVFVVLTWSCQKTSNESQTEETQAEEWLGMDEFHMVMAESFHPYRDSANLEPAKQYAAELVATVDNWSKNPLPSRVDNEDVRKLMEDLKVQCQQLLDVSALDESDSLGATLTRVHDTFHHLQEKWYTKGEHH